MRHTSCIVIVGNLCARHDDVREIFAKFAFFLCVFCWIYSFSCERYFPWGSWLIFIIDLLLVLGARTSTGFCFLCRLCALVYVWLRVCLLSFLDLIPFSWVVHGGSLTLSNLACLVPLVLGIISRQFTVKRNIYWQSIPFTSPPDAFKVGSHSAAAFWHFVIYLFISLFGQAAGVGRIRAHGEDLSSSARLSSAAADRVLFHSLQWKRVHRDLRASIVCALRCLITFDWTPY